MRAPFILFVSFLVLLLSAHPSLATDVSGSVSGTWTPSGNPYNVIREITLPAGQTLIIEPGVQVIFQGRYKFKIYGMLQAVGTEEDSILITAANPDIGFFGLRFYDLYTQADSSRLVYCHISYGVSSSVNSAGEDKHGGAIYASNSSNLLISHCLISNNRTGDIYGAPGQVGHVGTPGDSIITGHGGAIYLLDSNPNIAYCVMRKNHTGNAIGGTGGAGFSLQGIWITAGDGGSGGKAESGNGGAIYSAGGSPEIFGNIFDSNRTGTAIGGCGGAGGDAILGQNGGSAYGGDGASGASAQSGQGGAIYLLNGYAILNQNSFTWNFTGDATGGAGGEGGSAYYASGISYGTTQGGHGGNGNTGRAGSGGSIYFSSATLVTIKNNLIYSYNRTGYGRGGNGGHGGWGNMYGPLTNHGGDGGDGSNGFGGDGGAIYNFNSEISLSNFSVAFNLCGTGVGGYAGGGGLGQGNGSSGNPGQGTDGQWIIYSNSSLFLSNSIIWNNGDQPLGGFCQAIYSCIQGGAPGLGNINANPLFISVSQGDYFLSQITTGQSQQSPCVDAGCPDSAMIIGTTRIDGIQDSGMVDMGFHYPCFILSPTLVVQPDTLYFTAVAGGTDPPDQVFQIQNLSPDTFSFNVVEETNWLSVSDLQGMAPPSVMDTIHVEITGLSAGQYDGYIYVRTNGAQGSPDSVLVKLTLSPLNGLPDHQTGVTPETYCLPPVRPNPFNATTVITYGLPASASADLSIYNLQGSLVTTLVTGTKVPGWHRVLWDASGLPSGIYIVRLHSGSFTASTKMVLTK
jgi:hypothetical protein